MSLRLDNVVDPTRAEDRAKQVPADIWRKAKFVFPFSDAGIMGPFNKNFSEFLDWNDPDPPLFKSFLRVDALADRSRSAASRRPAARSMRTTAAGGPHQGHARRRRPWAWEVLLD